MSVMNPDVKFGAITFFARKHPGELCGSNGLPLTPNSVTIYGRSQRLKTLNHPHLCEYLDVIRGKHERIIVVSEHYKKSILDIPKPATFLEVKQIAKQILLGLSYLNEEGIIHRALAPYNILLDSDDVIKLFNYGLYYMSNYNKCVSFPIGNPKYTAPEVFLNRGKNLCGPKVDVWSLGIILAELALNKEFWTDLKLNQIVRRVLSLLNCSGTVFEHLANEHNCNEAYKLIPTDLKEFVNLCLKVDLKSRPVPQELLENEFLKSNEDDKEDQESDVNYHIGFLQRISLENSKNFKKPKRRVYTSGINSNGYFQSYEEYCKKSVKELSERSLKELYYLWQLAGGDVYSELKKQGMIKSKPPILTLPNLVLLEGTVFGEVKDLASMLDLRVIPLPMESLHQRLSHLSFESYYPLIETQSDLIVKEESPDGSSLPLIIREKDTEYQFYRIVLHKRLLLSYPYKKDAIIKEAEKDVPPFYRGDVWAALLGVIGDLEGTYEAIDKETPILTDRQIEVDIPRCHQYNELLSSSEGHNKLKRVLKAWVISHPQYVYWQGLDSLCAPFLYLNFCREAQAYACLSAFIPKYLNNFFLKDNSTVIQEYLAKFKHLIAFHDPELANHLDSINFIPELFAIPWFLTVFSHVFPLHKIFHLWDRLLLGDASFPLFIGLAVLTQLRSTLLWSGFNDCILLFSDLPEIDIERCVKDSSENYNNTPRSITYRQNEQRENGSSINPELEPSPLTIAELQQEFCPRISGSDFLYLLDVNKYSEHKALTVDIRNVDEYIMESLPDSINIPFNTVSLSEVEVPGTREGRILSDNKGKIIVVVGSGGENFTEFCRWLVKLGFPKVCSLHGGIQVLRKTGVLIPPN